MRFALAEIDLPVRLSFERPMTDDELLRFCAANEPMRVERSPKGEILVMTPAGFNTSRMNQRIGRLLDEWAETDGRGATTDSNGGYTLPDGSMLTPDAAWVALQRVEPLSAEARERFPPLSPDFVIQLRSPSDRLPELQAKMQQWIANGVQLGWLVDPKRKVVEIYRPGEQPAIHQDPTSVQGTGPVAGFELVMARVWG